MDESDYPEHMKAEKIKLEDSQNVGSFIDWLFSTYKNSAGERLIPGNYHEHSDGCYDLGDGKKSETNLCGFHRDNSFYPSRYDINEIICSYFDIDYKKLMAEKDKMLEDIRKVNKK